MHAHKTKQLLQRDLLQRVPFKCSRKNLFLLDLSFAGCYKNKSKPSKCRRNNFRHIDTMHAHYGVSSHFTKGAQGQALNFPLELTGTVACGEYAVSAAKTPLSLFEMSESQCDVPYSCLLLQRKNIVCNIPQRAAAVPVASSTPGLQHVLQGLRTRNAPKIKIKPFFGIPYGGLFGGCYGFVTAASEQHHGTALFEVLLCFILCTL
jgi:hypothetical protein